MKILRSLVSLAGLCAAATFAFGHSGNSAATKNDCCVNDAACCKHDAACCEEHAATTAAAATAVNAADHGCCVAGDESVCCDVVKAYVPVADALAADNLDQAQRAAADLARNTKADGPAAVYQAAVAVVHAKDIAAARDAFKQLSAVVTPLVKDNKDFVVMTCPMAKADWVQTDAKVRNPYFGSSMLTCGAPKKG